MAGLGQKPSADRGSVVTQQPNEQLPTTDRHKEFALGPWPAASKAGAPYSQANDELYNMVEDHEDIWYRMKEFALFFYDIHI